MIYHGIRISKQYLLWLAVTILITEKYKYDQSGNQNIPPEFNVFLSLIIGYTCILEFYIV